MSGRKVRRSGSPAFRIVDILHLSNGGEIVSISRGDTTVMVVSMLIMTTTCNANCCVVLFGVPFAVVDAATDIVIVANDAIAVVDAVDVVIAVGE